MHHYGNNNSCIKQIYIGCLAPLSLADHVKTMFTYHGKVKLNTEEKWFSVIARKHVN